MAATAPARAARTRPARPRSRRLRRRNQAVAAICVASALGGLLAPGAPTTLGGFDALLRAGFAVGLTLAAVQARRVAWATAAGLLVIPASGDPLVFAAALAVFAVTVFVSVRDYRTRVVGAAVGAGIAQVVLRLPAWGPNGTTALVGVAVTTMLVVSCLRSVRRRTRRRILLGLGLGAGVALACTAAFGTGLLLGRSDLQSGIDDAQAGVTAARRGDTATAIRRFDRASSELRAAAQQLDRPWSRVARVVPVVGQHQQALRTLVADAADLAGTGARAAREADVNALRLRNGRLDPVQVAALGTPLAQVSHALAVTARDLRGVQSPWFVGPLQHGVDHLTASVRRARHDAATARLAVRVAPQLLGATRPVNYFVMFVQPAEARASGGLMGNFAVLTVTDGHFEMSRFGRSSDLNDGGDPAARTITGPADYLARYARFSPATEWRNVNMSPDFPTVAQVVRQLYPQSGGSDVDGVLSLDPVGLAALLRFTGPVRVAGLDHPLTAKNAAQFLLEGQYLAFGANEQRVDFLDEAAHTITDRLLHGNLPGPRTVGKVLAGATNGGHLRAAFFDPASETLFDRLGATGRLRRTPGDTFGLVTQNASGNKIELFLHRRVDLVTTVDPSSGHTATTATVTLRNDSPTTGLPAYVIGNPLGLPPGTNRAYVSLYSTLGLTGATLDGKPVQLDQQREQGLVVYSTAVTIPAGGTVTLRLELAGGSRFAGTKAAPQYRLHLWHQNTVMPDHVSVQVRTAAPWHLGDASGDWSITGGSAGYRGTPRGDLVLGARVGS